MGQYYKIVNLDKRQYLRPSDFKDGAKLMEFGASGQGTMSALAVLLAHGNGRGFGDCRSEDPIVGSWAGDRIVVTGDYADPGGFGLPPDGESLYEIADGWENVGEGAMAALDDHRGIPRPTAIQIMKKSLGES